MTLTQCEIETAVFKTRLGWFGVMLQEGKLVRIVIGHDSAKAARAALESDRSANVDASSAKSESSELAQLERELTQFAAGVPTDFSAVDLDLSHLTEFQQRVAEVVRSIPAGETLSYAQVAELAGSPGAARAVGNVMANNRVPIVIPCHRVLGAAGRLGGFSAPGGVEFKKMLLNLESPEPEVN